ncbi:hypothetical protein N7452_010720 [Penicillium brevicompactum]|uniref:Uncharacterized protein n=1 Tax=Penicillium brevicompactum TaxID=5074 RepID=A0A9W9Q4K9_PENBR|nr:hypothetical protein N7452_010720 [Penicillium brevicompactum]
MQFKTLLFASGLILGASATSAGNATQNATDIAPAVQARLAQIDLGYQKTYLLLNHLGDHTANVTTDDVIDAYNVTASGENKALTKSQPTKPLSESTQLVLCQAYHSLALTGIQLNNAFVDYASHFNESQRDSMQSFFTKINGETGRFYVQVAKPALSYCLATLRADDKVVYDSLLKAVNALDPSTAPK